MTRSGSATPTRNAPIRRQDVGVAPRPGAIALPRPAQNDAPERRQAQHRNPPIAASLRFRLLARRAHCPACPCGASASASSMTPCAGHEDRVGGRPSGAAPCGDGVARCAHAQTLSPTAPRTRAGCCRDRGTRSPFRSEFRRSARTRSRGARSSPCHASSSVRSRTPKAR